MLIIDNIRLCYQSKQKVLSLKTLLEECKHEKKNYKMENFINDDLDLSSSDISDSESDNEFDNGSDNDESID